MWFEKNATIKDYVKYIFKRRGIKIGYDTGIPNQSFLKTYFSRYNNLYANIRLRVNDLIYYSLYNKDINIRFLNPLSKYDIIVFEKNFSKKAYLIASKYKNMGKKIIFDVNVNYFDSKSNYIKKQQRKGVLNFIKMTDMIITTTEYIKNYIVDNKIFSKVEYIPEIISDHFFNVKKKHYDKNNINLLYVGYAVKAIQLEIIKKEIESLNKRYGLKLILISEKPPKLNIKVPKTFIKYNQYNLPMDITKGDIFVAPRDLTESYNLGHSITKIGYPMAVGLPVVASPIPSYLKSPALICYNHENWYENLEKLINDCALRSKLGNEGINYCKKNFSKNIIMAKYIETFKKTLSRD